MCWLAQQSSMKGADYRWPPVQASAAPDNVQTAINTTLRWRCFCPAGARGLSYDNACSQGPQTVRAWYTRCWRALCTTGHRNANIVDLSKHKVLTLAATAQRRQRWVLSTQCWAPSAEHPVLSSGQMSASIFRSLSEKCLLVSPKDTSRQWPEVSDFVARFCTWHKCYTSGHCLYTRGYWGTINDFMDGCHGKRKICRITCAVDGFIKEPGGCAASGRWWRQIPGCMTIHVPQIYDFAYIWFSHINSKVNFIYQVTGTDCHQNNALKALNEILV